ncbi:MAG: sulfotransferase [Mycobacterium sp.]
MASLDFSPESLMDTARERSKLTNFGPEDFFEALAAYTEALQRNIPRFTEFGTLIAFEEIVGALENRLRIQDYIRQHPEITDEKISQPLFITGPYRSGTTKLQNLICSDDRWLYLRTWQTTRPVPMTEGANGEEDPRIAISRAGIEFLKQAAPQAWLAHPVEALDPGEEYPLMTPSFRLVEAKQINSGFGNWVAAQDNTPIYHDLHRALQVFQFQMRRPGEAAPRFCLKAPSHLGNIELLLKVFPDAKVVFTHRDPFLAIHSFAMLRESLHGLYTTDADPEAIGDETLEQAARALNASVDARTKFPEGTFFELPFRDILHDAISSVERIYRFADMPLTAESSGALTVADGLRDERSRAAKRHPALYGLTPDRVHDRAKRYMAWAAESEIKLN